MNHTYVYSPMHAHQGHIQHYHVPAAVTQSPAPQQQPQPQTAQPTTVAPSDTYNQPAAQPAQPQTPQQQQQASGSGAGQQAPLVAQGDWTKNLVHLAKTAELK